ncbi:Type II secretion system (T2SS), protein F (plasmid) [Neomoorella glycerini]|uniref:Type II secretion system (T2SS), protein F n=1 Tax=Neomoorella glycerini TaxID=55779 RepID=A0A6I5ZVR2_9FIRM|nr:type II secretion system F family protein [Moorella glycerini]QGP94130.1 Type II secretion system (T2SS), protein F [Moorella glycerini]
MLAFFFGVAFLAAFFFLAGLAAWHKRNPLTEVLEAYYRNAAARQGKTRRPILAELWQVETKDDMLPLALIAALTAVILSLGLNKPGLSAILALAAFIFVPRGYACWQKRRRQALFLAQLGRAVDNLASAIRAGGSVLDALKYAEETSPGPIKFELKQVREDIMAGAPLEKAVKDMAARIDLLEAYVLADGLALLAGAGGGSDAVRLLEGAAGFVREREHLNARIAAATGDVRWGFAVVTFIPLLLGLVMYLAMPEYRAVVTTAQGRLAVLAGIGCLVGGHIMVARIIKSGKHLL